MPTTPQPAHSQFTFFEPVDTQVLIQEIDTFAEALNGCYREMSAPAKADALRVGHALAKIRGEFNQRK